MLDDQQVTNLVQELVATAELLGHSMTPAAAALMADDLSAYPLPVLAQALRRVRSEHAGKLTPKVVLDRIDSVLGRPSAAEAWALALRARDEADTVVWTEDTAKAWDLARPVLAAGDKVGARFAFEQAYDRLADEARDSRRPPVWQVSIGWDRERRAAALERAVGLGLLTPAQAAQHAETLQLPAPVVNPLALIAGRVEPTVDMPAGQRARWLRLRDDLRESARREDRKRQAIDRLARMKQSARKRQINEQVLSRLAQQQTS